MLATAVFQESKPVADRARCTLPGLLAQLITMAGGVYLLAILAHSLRWGPSHVVVFWPSTGFAIGMMLRNPTRQWAALILASATGNALFNLSLPPQVNIAFVAANAFDVLAASVLVRWLLGEHPSTGSFRASSVVLLCCALVASPAAALLGTLFMSVAGAETEPFLSRFLGWWSSDALGAVLIIPLVLACASAEDRSVTRLNSGSRRVEALLLLAFVMAVSLFIFFNEDLHARIFIMPALLWAAFRFGTIGSALASSVYVLSGLYFGGGHPPHHVLPIGEVYLVAGDLQLPLIIYTGTALLIAAVVRDRERHAREALATQTLVSNISVACSDVIFVKDTDFRYLFLNRSGLEMLGRTSAKVIGRTTSEILGQDAPHSFDEVYRQILKTGELRTVEEELPMKDGRFHTFHTVAGPLFDQSGTAVGVFGVARDITDRKLAEQQLSEANRKLEAALEAERKARSDAEAAIHARDTFLAMVSHELRNPLSPASAAATLLKTLPGLPPEAPELIATIQDSVRAETRLISDLLDLTRAGTSKLSLHRVETDIGVLVAECVAKQSAVAGNLEVTVGFESALSHGLCLVDPLRMSQVINNLLSNSLKFTPSGGSIFIRCSNPSPASIQIEVSDTGTGFDRETGARIFELFQQGDRSIARKYGGLGIGLYLCRVLTEMHEGTIEAESPGPGQGATFRIHLATLLSGILGDDPTSGAGARGMVLLVEDNEMTLKLIARFLEGDGYRVLLAPGAESARALFREHQVDLIVSDIGLPECSGWDLLTELRQIRPVPAIAISGFNGPEDLARSRTAGYAAHITKPVDLLELAKVMHTLGVKAVGMPSAQS